jgi:hypothetical protein
MLFTCYKQGMKPSHNVNAGTCLDKNEIAEGWVKPFITVHSEPFEGSDELLTIGKDEFPYCTYETVIRGGQSGAGGVTAEIVNQFQSFLKGNLFTIRQMSADVRKFFLGVGLTANPKARALGYLGLHIHEELGVDKIDQLTSTGAIWLTDDHYEAREILEVFGQLKPADSTLADQLITDVRRRIKKICE